jgi:hypothetical protein
MKIECVHCSFTCQAPMEAKALEMFSAHARINHPYKSIVQYRRVTDEEPLDLEWIRWPMKKDSDADKVA